MTEAIEVYRATENNVKIIGRTHYYNDVRWLALSGSGVEFTFYGRKAQITLKGDAVALTGNNLARIAICVNGVRVIDEQLDRPLATYTVFESDTEQEITVTVIKLSEAAMSTAGIVSITVDAAEGIKPAPASVHKIEFIEIPLPAVMVWMMRTGRTLSPPLLKMLPRPMRI